MASTTTCMRRVRSVRAKTQCLESNTLPKGQQIGRRTQPSPRFILPVIWRRTENRILVSLPAWLDVCFSCTTLGHIMERKGQRKCSFSWIAVYFTSHLHACVWWNPCSHHCLHSRAVIWQHIRVWITQDRHTAREDTMTMKPRKTHSRHFTLRHRDWEALVRQFNWNLFLTNISAF